MDGTVWDTATLTPKHKGSSNSCAMAVPKFGLSKLLCWLLSSTGSPCVTSPLHWSEAFTVCTRAHALGFLQMSDSDDAYDSVITHTYVTRHQHAGPGASLVENGHIHTTKPEPVQAAPWGECTCGRCQT